MGACSHLGVCRVSYCTVLLRWAATFRAASIVFWSGVAVLQLYRPSQDLESHSA
eukprot:COSAG01_NODE_40612_length_461_cov_1.842541_1_plen_53_part_10